MTRTGPSWGAGEPDDDGVDAVRRALAAVGAEVGGPALAAQASGGKLLRARIASLIGRLGAPVDPARAIRLAAAIELLHAGVLCHDDVVDGCPVRRSRPTIEAIHGTRAAVLAGLFLMLRGLVGLAGEPEPLRRAVARAVRDVARGRTDEGLDLFETGLSPEAYLRRAQAKTGALYELAGRLGAAAGELDGLALDGAASYAASFGVAFQLAHDVRDLVGDPGLGRAPGADLRQGVYTLPVLLTLSGRHPGAEVLRDLLSEGDRSLAECVALLRANGALSETERLAAEQAERALAALSVFPASAVRRRLEALVRSVLEPAGAERATWYVERPATHAERVAAYAATAERRTTFRPVSAHYLFAMDGGLSSRLEVVAERLQRGLSAPPLGAQGWVDGAGTTAALGVTLFWLADRIVDATPGRSLGVGVRNAAFVGATDLAVGSLAGLLANVPAAVARELTESLSRRLARAAAALFADRACSIQLDDAAVVAFADEVAAAGARCLASEGSAGG